MNCSFQLYLLDVGIRSSEYTYKREVLWENIPYFNACWKQSLSPYKALLFLHDHLNYKNDSLISSIFDKTKF